jgi:prepilin-type N-terminal cleavage/methylation domain-containing protein
VNAPESRGFTLLETVVAVAIAAVLSIFLLRAATAMIHGGDLAAARMQEEAAAGELTDRLEADEDSAWAIFTPPNDVLGASNGDGHELDFFTRDQQSNAYFWAYTYDAAAQTVTRYTYNAPGARPTADVTYARINSFFAHTYPVSALQQSGSRIVSPLYAGAALQPGATLFFPSSAPWIAGGNQITYLRFSTAANVRELQLTTQTAPSGYIVVLRYTPSPAPNGLNVWPAFVEIPVSGTAAGPCAVNQARAFTDGTFGTVLANQVAPSDALPSGVTGSTNANGCITITSASFTNGSPNVALFQDGYTGVFSQTANACGPSVKTTSEYPGSGNGPTVQVVSAGMQPQVGCTVTWQGKASTAAASVTYEVAGCTNSSGWTLIGLGSTCDFGPSSTTTGEYPDCSLQGGGNSGGEQVTTTTTWTIASGPGTISTSSGDGVITRIGSGPIQVATQTHTVEYIGCPVHLINGTASGSFTVAD